MVEPLLQTPTPDTVSYLVLGYLVVGVVGLGYVATLLIRWRRLRRDLALLRRLQEEERSEHVP